MPGTQFYRTGLHSRNHDQLMSERHIFSSKVALRAKASARPDIAVIVNAANARSHSEDEDFAMPASFVW